MRALVTSALVCLLAASPAAACVASWYGPKFHGRPTASGEIFDQWGLTAAHRKLSFGTRVRVTRGRRSVVVTINDRGPYVGGKCIDLSRGAARRLGMERDGVAEVHLEILRKRSTTP